MAGGVVVDPVQEDGIAFYFLDIARELIGQDAARISARERACGDYEYRDRDKSGGPPGEEHPLRVLLLCFRLSGFREHFVL